MEVFVYRQGADAVETGLDREQLPELLADTSNVVWVDLQGETPEQIEYARDLLQNVFHFHKLTVERCFETRNPPKVEAFDKYIYLIIHGIKPGETSTVNFATKELDAFLGINFVVTFHIQRFRSIKTVKDQLRTSPFICRRGSSYLLHHILDEIIDLYMPVVEDFDRSINALEEKVFDMKHPSNTALSEIMDLRRSVARLRRISARQLDVLYRISHGEFPQIPASVLPFYRDVHDHLVRITDLAEGYRDLISGLFEIHFSVLATRTNEIMKTLAIVSAIILPLSLIAGIYGMNFENMPELKAGYGYYITLAVMALIAISLLGYFKRKGWIFQSEDDLAPKLLNPPDEEYDN
ncbi:MAG: magnesium/cobalt transporter CorA [Chloracidobacterium sp.]|nr:magnesium/cobalt transporter CorA [Chloracidobacterium sp.]MCO5333570.1 magnesium/cobalt transporter CorA [Pyrinomonadaceae bacterium]